MTTEDNEYATKACKSIHYPWTAKACWIGLQRPWHEWNDGTNAEEKYSNWNPGEPNNYRGWNEHCAELIWPHQGRWNDLNCGWRRYFLWYVTSSMD